MTRVLFLTESFHPVLGGGETHIRRLGGRLVAMGHVATVVTRRSAAAWPSVDEVDGVRVRRVGPSGPARTGKYLMVPGALRAAKAGQETIREVADKNAQHQPGKPAAQQADYAADHLAPPVARYPEPAFAHPPALFPCLPASSQVYNADSPFTV